MTSKYGNDCQIWKRGDGSNDKNTDNNASTYHDKTIRTDQPNQS